MLWDAMTGDVVLTQTQNEFDDPVYNLSFPAYWMYDGMGMAYQNDGTYLQSLATDANGMITNALIASLLTQGDELLDLGSGSIYWATNSDGHLRLINRDGTPATGLTGAARVIHSGRRNLLSGAASTFSTLVNPIVGNQLNLSYATKILDAKASEYSQTWNVPNAYCYQCPPGFTLSADSTYCYQDTAPTFQLSSSGCNTVSLGDNDPVYSTSGTLIYNAGYQVAGGAGTVADTITNNSFWINSGCSNVPLKRTTGGACQLAVNPSYDDSLAATLCGPLNRCGIWTNHGYDAGADRYPVDTTITVAGCFAAPSTGTYYMGVGGDNQISVSIDSVQVINLSGAALSNYRYWHIYPITLQAGQHTIQIQGYNVGNIASIGVEIYNSSITQLLNAHSTSQANVIFTSLSLDNQSVANGAYSCPVGAYLNDCGEGSMVCHKVIPVSFKVNPYTKGFLGNWRTARSYVFQTARENLVAGPAVTIPGATNIRTSGAYASFVPYWSFGGSWTTSTDARWVRRDEATGFSPKGDGIESRDALNNYSAALFGYLQSLPVAVASNARYREIGYDGFEDYGFLLNCMATGCTLNHFSFFPYLSGTIRLDTTMAHSGHCSLQLTGAVTLSKRIYPAADAVPFNLDAQGGYQQNFSQWTQGLSLIAGKQYILSLWINDGAPRQATTSTSLLVNGASVINSSMIFPVVEGWKRVEVPFTLPAGSTSFALTIQPSGTLHVDDIRIHPFDSEMKTMAYDARSQRLMAVMDENNFATFYEYDDEGTLIRVKKETERGIMTIKETRSSYKY